MKNYGTFSQFLEDKADKVFRFWVYRRMFTPFEQEQKFSDESVYESTYARYGYIKECVPVGDNDYLLGIQPVYDNEVFDDELEYYKFSELRLFCYDTDQIVEESEE